MSEDSPKNPPQIVNCVDEKYGKSENDQQHAKPTCKLLSLDHSTNPPNGISLLFWESFSNLFDVSAILFKGVTSFLGESKCSMWLSLDELFSYFDVTRVFELA